MNYKDIEEIKKAGFVGFKTMRELFVDSSEVSKVKGVYLVLNLTKKGEFVETGTGGHFKGKNPNIPISELKQNWVEDTIVVYIGKAGGKNSKGKEFKATLNSRLKQYFKFGQGKNVGHWGGRLIWQLKNSSDLVVCWKELPTSEPIEVEVSLIQDFASKFSKRPFANITN